MTTGVCVGVGVAVGGAGVCVIVGVEVGGSGVEVTVAVGVPVGVLVGGPGVAVGVDVGGTGVAVGVTGVEVGVLVTVGGMTFTVIVLFPLAPSSGSVVWIVAEYVTWAVALVTPGFTTIVHMTGTYVFDVADSRVSFVASTVVAPLGVPSGAGQVNDTASAVASQGMPPPSGRLFAVTV